MEILSNKTKTQSWLTWFLRGLLFLGILILLVRLIDLQLIRGNYFKLLANENRIRRIAVSAPRGRILARGGEVLVSNKEVKKKIVFNPEKGYEKTNKTEGSGEDELVSDWTRFYLLGEGMAHISGYLGEVNEEELGKVNPECPEKGPASFGKLVGRGGLEEKYDCVLSGIDGEELIEVNASGEKIRTLGEKKAISGVDIKTLIDYGLQKKLTEIIKSAKDLPLDKRGAVIVEDAKSEILALYSFPSFDPNIFVNQEKGNEILKVLNDQSLPLFNRAISGVYHPGSTFKPLVAIAALEEGVIDEDYTYDDKGQIVLKTAYGDFSYKNWYFTQYGGVEGVIKLPQAIARSTDTFFYALGELAGIDNITKWAANFGLNDKLEVDLPSEAGGLIPSPQWKMEVVGERWFLGNTYHLSIGQGYVSLTPLAVNNTIVAIANGGSLCTPKVVDFQKQKNEGYDFPGFAFFDNFFSKNIECRSLEIDKNNIELVKEGMRGACEEGGTGFTFFDFAEKHDGIEVACKTGTAETDDRSEPHAWFVAFAPVEDPDIIVTVLVENGGEGSKVAGPIAREIFDYWLGEAESTQDETGF